MKEFMPHVFAGAMYEPFDGARVDVRGMPDRYDDAHRQWVRILRFHDAARTHLAKGDDVAFCCARGTSRSPLVAALFCLRAGYTPPPFPLSPEMHNLYVVLSRRAEKDTF